MRSSSGLDIDGDRIIDLGRDKDAGEGGVTALGLVKRRDAHQPVDACFPRELPIGELAGHRKRSRLDARLFAVLIVIHLRLEAVAFSPTEIHAHQHFGPVLRFGAPGARVNSHDGIQRIGFLGEHGAGFELLHELA